MASAFDKTLARAVRPASPGIWAAAASLGMDWRSLVCALLGGVGFFALSMLCITLARIDSALASVWLPGAFAVALILLARPRGEWLVLAAIAAGSFTAHFATFSPLSMSLGFTAANLAAVVLVVQLVRRHCGDMPDISDPAQLGRFLLYAGIVGPLASTAIVALAGLTQAGGGGWMALAAWYLANSMGMILVLPAALLIADAVRRQVTVPTNEMAERLALMAGGYLAVFAVLQHEGYSLLFLVPPITLLFAFRLGAMGTALYVPGVALVAAWMSYAGNGPGTQDYTADIADLFVLQAFLTANFLTGLPVAAILAGRGRLAQELVEGRSEVALLTESITDAVLKVERNRICTYASPSVEDVLGRAPSDFVGKPFLWRTHPESQELLADTLDALLDGVFAKKRITYRRLLDDEVGNPVYIEADCAAVLDPVTGAREGIIVSARDITDRVVLERQLTGARRHAERAANAKSEFLANMSHEIRTPMNGVLGFAEMMLQTDLDAENRRYAEMIVQSGRSMMLLLNDILDLSKIEAGEISIDERPVDPFATIAECLTLHRPMAEKKGLTVHFDLPTREDEEETAPYPWLVTDGLRLRQIVLNLIGNAVKFTESGRIDITCHTDPAGFCVEVRDTGIGISAHRLESIFAPFTQGENDIARRFGGTGLGLTISRQLAQLLGGTIEVSSEAGVGSTFRLTLPPLYARAEEPPPALPLRLAASEIPTGARILLVEDHDVNRMLGCEMLERCGQQVSIAHDGNEAIAMVIDSVMRDAPYDLVLMDIQMPGCDGYAATRTIRAEGIGPDVLPIIAMTANAFPEDVSAARKAGMQAHLAKPLVFAELVRVLERWLPMRIIGHDEALPMACDDAAEDAPTHTGEWSVDERRTPRKATAAPSRPAPSHSPALLRRWNQRRSEVIEAVRAALENGALGEGGEDDEGCERLARLVHKLAGTAAIFGEPELGDHAAVLERALRTGPRGALREKLAFELLSVADDPADTLARASA